MKISKKLLVLLVVATMFFTITIPSIAVAESITRTLNATFGITVHLDGKTVEYTYDANGQKAEAFIADGVTYLPVRAIAEAVGKDVAWDQVTQTVKLSTPGVASTGTYSRTNPAPIGTAQKVTVSNYLETYDATISITESFRGVEAWTKIKAANMFNSEAPTGKEYVLVKAKAIVGTVKDDTAINFNSLSFEAYSMSSVEYSGYVSVVVPVPQFTGNVFTGGTLEGYLAFLVNKTDTAPKAVFGADYDGTGGIWFALTK